MRLSAGYNYGVRTLGASEACIFNNAIPIFSLITAVIIGQESFSWIKVLGIIVVISGVAFASVKLDSKEYCGNKEKHAEHAEDYRNCLE